jgi:excisionase family DNA binding protein
MTTATRDLMSTSEAARCLGIAAETLRGWVKQGKIAGRPTPLGLLFDADVVHDFAARRDAAATERRRGRT